MTLIDAFNKVSDTSNAVFSAHLDKDDYVAGGLIHCHKCGTAKQVSLKLPEVLGGGMKVQGCLCKCQLDELAKQKERDRREAEMAAVGRLRSTSLMDEQFRRSRLDTFCETPENKRALMVCRRYAERFSDMEDKNQGLLFHGAVGTGKTFAAACIANALIDERIAVLMTSLVHLLRVAYEGGERWQHTLSDMRKARLLVIDDLGAERSTDTALEHVYGIVDDRYRDRKPVIFTTNLTLEQMRNTPDMRCQRIYDRVLETCYPVEFTGASKRIEEAADRYDKMRAFLGMPKEGA